MVLLPKGKEYFKGIRLVEVIWNFFICIINNCLRPTIILHDFLPGFSQVRGPGEIALEAKLAQQLTDICDEPLL